MAGSPTTTLSMIDDVMDRQGISSAQITIIVIALILNMLDGFDVTAMAFTAHSIGESLQIPPQQLGIVFSTALAGMMLGAMFLAPYSDVIGRRNMLLICVLAIGASMVLTGYTTALWQLVILRAITGLGVGSMLASLATITSEYTPARYRSLTVVSITAGYPLGATMGGFIAAPLLTEYGWPSIFFVGGVATLLMVAVVYLWVPESLQFLITKRPPGALEKINDALVKMDKEPLKELPAAPAATEASKASVFSLLTPERRARTLQLWSTFFFCFISLYFLMSWVPKLVINSGLSEAQGVYGAVAFNGGGVIGILMLGWMAAGRSLSQLIAVFLCGAAITMTAFATLADHLPLLVSLAVIGFLLQGGFTGLYAVAAKIYPTEVRTTGVGWAIGLGRFGAVVGPYVGGIFIAMGMSMELNFYIFAVPMALAGLLAFRLKVQ
ncbi:MFS transporter [Pseudomaricurvus alkylphenolicus]|uniref:MFS transporter n=1 Tax=Pseudomaricurvus alkylphenolicus TaxID=1306991 RepID=UPI001422BC5E|nr:MFS transporter [Pseudomaricurvus alkylphenolicus]NIB43887.1 MFS transporter [Pseudomaricurvus alkylphenolicus]